MKALVIASFLLHCFFIIGIHGNNHPNSPNVFDEWDAMKLFWVQVLSFIGICFAAFSQPPAAKVFVAFALISIAAHVWGFRLWLRRRDAPEGSAGFRLFEDVLYGTHCAVAAIGILAYSFGA